MSNNVRNALVFAGVVTVSIALLILAWRIARWLFIGAVWLVALTVVGLLLLTKLWRSRRPSGLSAFAHIMPARTVRVSRRDCRPARPDRSKCAPRYAQELS
jgi:hypothetical protein